jgi:hypothetical protein
VIPVFGHRFRIKKEIAIEEKFELAFIKVISSKPSLKIGVWRGRPKLK